MVTPEGNRGPGGSDTPDRIDRVTNGNHETPEDRYEGGNRYGNDAATTRTNPHDEEHATENVARATGAMAGMFFPVIILTVVAIILIGYFLLR